MALDALRPGGDGKGPAPLFGAVSARRRLSGSVMMCVTALAATAALFPLLDILWVVVSHGLAALNASVFTTLTQGAGGGLENAILGTLLLLAMATAMAAPVGVGAGVYLTEVASERAAGWLRYLGDVLLGVPSIVVGYFLYAVLVTSGGAGWGYSSLAGAIALAVIMLPYIARTTELALRKVPRALREGGLALGVTQAATLVRVQMPVAAGSIVTGILLSMGIGLGETAPLLYTAGWSSYDPSLTLTHSPVGYLTYVVWTYINEPYASAHRLAYTAALLLMAGVLGLNLVARSTLTRREENIGV